jgi:hypothetical protein
MYPHSGRVADLDSVKRGFRACDLAAGTCGQRWQRNMGCVPLWDPFCLAPPWLWQNFFAGACGCVAGASFIMIDGPQAAGQVSDGSKTIAIILSIPLRLHV